MENKTKKIYKWWPYRGLRSLTGNRYRYFIANSIQELAIKYVTNDGVANYILVRVIHTYLW